MSSHRLCVVTGGAGFIGSHIAELLLGCGDAVRVLDNFSSGSWGNIAPLKERYPDKLEVIEADIRDQCALRVAMQQAELVFHEAAIVSVQKSMEDPLETNSVNLDGTLGVLHAAREAGVRKLVFASSTAVYGSSEVLPKTEEMRPEPLSPYAAAKYAGEVYASVFSAVYGLQVVCLRYFNVYGPRQDPSSEYAAVIPRFLVRMLSGKPPLIFGDGAQTRDFVFVQDVARANLLAAECAPGGTIVNIASGESHSLNELVFILNDILGLETAPVHEPARMGEVRHSRADISRAGQILGYIPQVSLREGLRRTIASLRKMPGNPRHRGDFNGSEEQDTETQS